MKLFLCTSLFILLQFAQKARKANSSDDVEDHSKLFQLVRQRPWVKAREKLKNVLCPGGRPECQHGTCCKTESGDFACCPYDNAVCCADKKHCCPRSFTCDVKKGKCIRQHVSIKLSSKMTDRRTNGWLTDAVRKLLCRLGTTCNNPDSSLLCCCPFENPVWCSDKKHCCPQGYTCDASEGACIKHWEFMSFSAMASVPMNSRTVACLGGKDFCSDGSTCCTLPTGQHSCCPFPGAACCTDGEHCCPSGYRCNSFSGNCVGKNEKIKSLNTSVSLRKRENIVCPGGEDECPDGDTCCKSSSGGYGCCPIPNAVCCSDGKNCCPHGYKCNPKKGLCDKNRSSAFYGSLSSMWNDGETPVVN